MELSFRNQSAGISIMKTLRLTSPQKPRGLVARILVIDAVHMPQRIPFARKTQQHTQRRFARLRGRVTADLD